MKNSFEFSAESLALCAIVRRWTLFLLRLRYCHAIWAGKCFAVVVIFTRSPPRHPRRVARMTGGALFHVNLRLHAVSLGFFKQFLLIS